MNRLLVSAGSSVRCSGIFFGLAVFAVALPAALVIPSDGSDGAFEPTGNVVIDLSEAVTGSWDTPGTGTGVYDPEQWAVVFKFTSVNIPSGVTVTFLNHPSRAPVIWLAEGDVVIEGTVALDGAAGHGGNSLRSFAEPGPGGFRGGRGSDAQTVGAGGMGPGGSSYGPNNSHASSGGSYGTVGGTATTSWGGNTPGEPGQTYGNAGVFPLIGGSGAAGSANGEFGKGGGAGGGAILIATPGSLLLNGQIRANGGSGSSFGGPGGATRASGGGSGGGIRVIADSISGSGLLRALGGANPVAGAGTQGGQGGVGRIRVEAFTNELIDTGNPAFSLGVPEDPPRIFRDPSTPAIRSVSLAGASVSEDPRSELSFPNTDLTLPEAGPVTLLIEAEHVPLDSEVRVRVVRRTGADTDFLAVHTGGTFEASTWSAEVDVAGGFSTIQVRAGFAGGE
ncbi:MAG: hypothetical protein JJU00_10365 [Opitutales bacterium]|nr:hypothetical protein [Opitutales bacterium]